MVLPIKDLAGFCARLSTTHLHEVIDSCCPARSEPAIHTRRPGPVEDAAAVPECSLQGFKPVSTRQALHSSIEPCLTHTRSATPPDSWSECGRLPWLSSRALGTMGKKRKPWIPPPPLDSAILVAEDALVSGADVLITGGAHKRIHGLKGYILPSSEENSATVNVRLYQGHATLQSKIWCVDRSNVAVSGPGPPVEDDGLHPSLRWRLRPPPLTVFSVRFVLGWQSLATMVPMKPDKRPQQGTPGSGRQPVTRLWQGVRRISKEGALLPQPLASARGDPPCTFEAAERAPVAAAFGKEKHHEGTR